MAKRPRAALEVVVLCLPGCLPSGLVGLVDLLSLLDRAAETAGEPAPSMRVRVAGLTERAIEDGRGGRQQPDVAIGDIERCDAILVPGFLADLSTLEAGQASFRPLFRWLSRQHAHGAWVLGSCAASWVLGQAGLLRGRRCTTTWWLHDALARRFPEADWAWGAALTEDTRVVTAGGPLSWVDIALCAVRALCGLPAARALANFAVLDGVPVVQARLVPAGGPGSEDEFVQLASQWVRQARGTALSTGELARKMGVSERTLHRRLRAATGEAPLAFCQRIRLESARMLLDTSALPIKAVAHQTGWRDEGTFRRAFRRLTGQSPAAYRAWAAARRGEVAGQRHRGHDTAQQIRLGCALMSEALPVVDFRLLSGNERDRDAFAQAFGDGLKTYGFGVVAEHPIGTERIARAFELCDAFFSQPTEVKRKYVVGESTGNRGYVPFGGERAVGAPVADLKEFFHVGQEQGASAQLRPNLWPAEVPGFRDELTALFRDFEATARGLLVAVERYLDLPEGHFSSTIEGGDSILRLLHYPPIPGDAHQHAVRAGAHEDINLITLLAEGSTGGLELRRKDGSWMPVRSLRGQLVINTGDMLQRATHGRLSSTTHRVTNPTGPNISRYSIPFFTHPRPEVMLDPMAPPEGWVGPVMTPISAGDFLDERLRAIKAG